MGPKKVPEVEVLALTAPEDEDKSDAVLSKHPSKNYTKFNLYNRWVKARTDVSTYKQEVRELEKESVRDKKEIAKLYKELNKETEKVEKLQDKVDDLLLEVEEEQVKSKSEETKLSKVSNTERIQNMQATFQSLQSKQEYKHKTVLCELQLKYNELNLHLKSKDKEIGRLKERLNLYKKDKCNIKELKVASLKSKIQVSSMRERNNVR